MSPEQQAKIEEVKARLAAKKAAATGAGAPAVNPPHAEEKALEKETSPEVADVPNEPAEEPKTLEAPKEEPKTTEEQPKTEKRAGRPPGSKSAKKDSDSAQPANDSDAASVAIRQFAALARELGVEITVRFPAI